MRPTTCTRSTLYVLIATLAAACGGGGGGAAPTPQPPTTPAPSPNQAPRLFNLNDDVEGIEGHAFRYDASQGGTTFYDPDGDSLTYTVTVEKCCASSGSWITSTALPRWTNQVAVIVARDGRGGEASDNFVIRARDNQPPVISSPNGALLTGVGAHVNYDLTQGGRTFSEADGDSLTYSVEMVSPADRGVVAEGLRAIGTLSAVGAAAFRITASDGYGGAATDTFVVAAPAPLPGPPNLPAVSYPYADEDLQLPYEFRVSFIEHRPFWDTATTRGFFRPVTNAGATLGRALFYDKRLSVTNTHSCGSCHEQALGFATADRFPTGVIGVPLRRNAIALTNSRYNDDERWFSDARAPSLEQLALEPITEITELATPLPLAIERLAATDFYPVLFEAAFGTPEITADRMRTALVQFLRSINSWRTRFDQAYLHAEEDSPDPDPTLFLTELELEGQRLFDSNDLQCSSCHGTAIHTLERPSNNGLDAVLAEPGVPGFEGKFRSGSLRNIAVTAPYMRDGRFATLREVIDHYDHGVQDSPHLGAPLRAFAGGPPRRLNLTDAQKDALEAFLRMLTDDALLVDPRLSDPFQ